MCGCQSPDSFFLTIFAFQTFLGAPWSPAARKWKRASPSPAPGELVILWRDRGLQMIEGQGLPREGLSWLWNSREAALNSERIDA